MDDRPGDEDGHGPDRRLGSRLAASAKRLDKSERLISAARIAREILPGDSNFGDPLSTAGAEQPQVAGRHLAQVTEERRGFLREAGLTALQVWQAAGEASGRGHGTEDVAILFTDLVEFSEWALGAGDEAAVLLLREVGRAMEPPVNAHGGEVVKRLGDGMMAAFGDAGRAVDAVLDARSRMEHVEVAGYRPRFRAGVHVGKPRRIGGDYLGVDVNVAARVAEQAAADELLVSGRALQSLDTERFEVRRKRRFKVKGVPADMEAYRLTPRA